MGEYAQDYIDSNIEYWEGGFDGFDTSPSYTTNPLYYHTPHAAKRIRDTDKATLIYFKDKDIYSWVPKSLIRYRDNDPDIYIWEQYTLKPIDYKEPTKKKEDND